MRNRDNTSDNPRQSRRARRKSDHQKKTAARNVLIPEAPPAAGPQSAAHSNVGRRPSKKQGYVRRTVNQWWDRLLGAASDGSLSGQEEEYAAHRTSRDYIWNTAGVAAWGIVFPLLTVIATQLAGVEKAGMFSLAFVTGTLLMIIANYGVRTYQVSDIDERHSFSDYQINRWITCVIMIVVGVLYCTFRGYGAEMFTISVGVYVYKMIDGLADVYEGRLQQKDKLYLAGVSQTIRSVLVFIVFSVCLFVSGNLAAASVAMAVAAAASFVFVTFPLALLETPKSKRMRFEGVKEIFKQCWPLFIALFLYSFIDNMPKFVMEGVLSYDNQLYFNALYFPAQAILLTVGFIYKPLLVRMANTWADPKRRKRFDLLIVVIVLIIVALTVIGIWFMDFIGIRIMGFLYGVDFEQYRTLCFLMLVAGGFTGGIDFLYQVITVLRRHKDVTKLYLITFIFALFIPALLVNLLGLQGAVIGYMIVMSILFVLLLWEYISVRISYMTHPEVDPLHVVRSSAKKQPAVRVPVHRRASVNATRQGAASGAVSSEDDREYTEDEEATYEFELPSDAQGAPSAGPTMVLPEIEVEPLPLNEGEEREYDDGSDYDKEDDSSFGRSFDDVGESDDDAGDADGNRPLQ